MCRLFPPHTSSLLHSSVMAHRCALSSRGLPGRWVSALEAPIDGRPMTWPYSMSYGKRRLFGPDPRRTEELDG